MGLADDEKATAKAARTAQTAADLAESRGHGIEMTSTSASGSQTPSARSPARASGSGTYNISGSLTKETAASAVKKLADLRGESQKLMSQDPDAEVSCEIL